jgi:hypothetical protein
MTAAPPVTALAQFFDDIRVENNGKGILIGQYISEMGLPPGVMPVDRLAIVLTLRWPHDCTPQSIGARIELPGQPAVTPQFPLPPPADPTDQPVSAFACPMIQAAFHLRFLPLRAGDVIDVWAVVDGHDIPAGRLRVVASASAEQTVPPPP